jgi:hypothetical protein
MMVLVVLTSSQVLMVLVVLTSSQVLMVLVVLTSSQVLMVLVVLTSSQVRAHASTVAPRLSATRFLALIFCPISWYSCAAARNTSALVSRPYLGKKEGRRREGDGRGGVREGGRVCD